MSIITVLTDRKWRGVLMEGRSPCSTRRTWRPRLGGRTAVHVNFVCKNRRLSLISIWRGRILRRDARVLVENSKKEYREVIGIAFKHMHQRAPPPFKIGEPVMGKPV